MNRAKGSVRIGPLSLLTLIIVVCLAVMAVLTAATVNASYAVATKQALFASDTYANEDAAQHLVANVDAALETARIENDTLDAALAAVDDTLPAEAERTNTTVQATFVTDNGRSLTIEIIIRADATYEITQWKATTLWDDQDTDKTLWSNAVQTG